MEERGAEGFTEITGVRLKQGGGMIRVFLEVDGKSAVAPITVQGKKRGQ